MASLAESVIRRYKKANLPDLQKLISVLSRLPGVILSERADQWREGQDTCWYRVLLSLESKREMDVETRAHGPHIRRVVEFVTNPVSLGRKAKQIIEGIGGYGVKLILPERKRVWTDPKFGPSPGVPKSYYVNNGIVVEFYISQVKAEENS